MKKVTQIFAALFLLLLTVFLWYFKLQTKPKDEAVFYLPKNADVLVKVHTSFLLQEAALRPLFNNELDEDKRTLVFQADDVALKSGINFKANAYLSYETFRNQPLLIALVNIQNGKDFEGYCQRKNIVATRNAKVGLLVLLGTTKSTALKTYLKQILTRKRAIPLSFSKEKSNKPVMVELLFQKKKSKVILLWQKESNSLQIEGELPRNHPIKNTLCINNNAFYLSFPVGILKPLVSDTVLQNIISSLESIEIAYRGSKVSIDEQKVSPNANVALHFLEDIPQNFFSNLKDKGYFKGYNDSILSINFLPRIAYRKTISSLYLYFDKIDTCVSKNNPTLLLSAGSLKSLLNFYENSQLARFFIASKPLLKQIAFLIDAVEFQKITCKNQSLNGEIRFSKDVNVPFEVAYWMKLLELRH